MSGFSLTMLAGPDPMTRLMAWGELLTVVVGVVAALCTVMVVFMFWNAFTVRKEARDAVDGFENKLRDLDTTYNLSKMKLPEEILEEALGQVRNDYEPRLSAALSSIGVISAEVRQLKDSLASVAPKSTIPPDVYERLDQIMSTLGLPRESESAHLGNTTPEAGPKSTDSEDAKVYKGQTPAEGEGR